MYLFILISRSHKYPAASHRLRRWRARIGQLAFNWGEENPDLYSESLPPPYPSEGVYEDDEDDEDFQEILEHRRYEAGHSSTH
jgi:hypothetical protein